MHENIVVLQGWLDGAITRDNKLWGVKYDHFKAVMLTNRRNDVVDVARIIIPAAAAEDVQLIMAASKGNYMPVTCIGRLQTVKDWKSGAVHLFVLADFIGIIRGDWEQENKVILTKARLGKQPRKRETPLGRRIVDTTIKVHSIIGKGYCYIPTIFWENELEEISRYKEGDTIAVSGRLQSRIYKKRLQGGEEEVRTAYELSVRSIEENSK